LDRRFDSLEQLSDYLQWDSDGWDWSFYGPLVADSLSAGVSIRSANITAAQVGEIYGLSEYPAVAGILDEAAMEQLNREIDESHCGLLPASQFPAMVRVQQARDHRMAASLTATVDEKRMNLLIAGNYHVRQDLGVPRYLLAAYPGLEPGDILSVALLEVDPRSEDPREYLQGYSERLPFDYIWFTPAISDEDYCASLAR
jgi:uncharacterized iron-regulated protein